MTVVMEGVQNKFGIELTLSADKRKCFNANREEASARVVIITIIVKISMTRLSCLLLSV